MQKYRALLNRSLPFLLVLICVIVISRFFIEPFKFPVNDDDCLYNALLQNHSVWELMQAMAGKYSGLYISHFDGRLFSNFFLLLVFSVIKTHVSIYYLYDLFMFLLLVVSFYSLINSLVKKGITSHLSLFKKWLLSSFTSCLFLIFLIDGRYEIFYWVSSTANHLLSIILFVFALTLFIGKPNFLSASILALLSFCLAQMNEIYGVSYFFIFLLITLSFPKLGFSFLIFSLFFFAGLAVNILTHGTMTRINTMSAASHYNFLFAIEDTYDTFKLPFINFRYLPIKIPAGILFFLSVRDYFQIKFAMPDKLFFGMNRLLLLMSVTGIFLHCYIMGEVCTYRGLLFYSLSLIYFIFMMAVKNTANPLKLFVK